MKFVTRLLTQAALLCCRTLLSSFAEVISLNPMPSNEDATHHMEQGQKTSPDSTITRNLQEPTVEYQSDEEIQQRQTDRSFRFWLVNEFPNPDENEESSSSLSSSSSTCGTGSSTRLCDPDGILTQDDVTEVSRVLDMVRRSGNLCDEEKTDASIEIQLAIALVKKMDLTPFRSYDDQVDRAVESFARQVHDNWGVGMETVCGGTGVLLFLSTFDRAVYVSRGKAMENFLTNARLDRTIKNMIPFLQKARYKDALIYALSDLDAYFEKGPPKFYEQTQDFVKEYMSLFWFFGLFSYIIWGMRKQHVERREYARLASQLDEIDRARAQALQGQYKVESCPICFEPFQRGDNDGDENDSNPTVGSDGRSIKLLRCGHVFDETCWEEWVASGQGQVDKCPICKMDIGRIPNEGQATVSRLVDQQREEDFLHRRQQEEEDSYHRQEHHALRRYNYERQFRLARLGLRYPQYIGSQQIAQWTQSTYNGALARDPNFRRHDPNLRHQQAANGNNGMRSRGVGSSGFGGGSSTGGRAGRW